MRARSTRLEDSDIPRGPIDPAKLKPEQIKHIHRKVRHILFGGVLRLAPSFTLLVIGLSAGLLLAIPIYLVVRFACIWGQLKRKGEHPSWKQWPDLSALLLGGASLATQNPIWFQLEVPVNFLITLSVWVIFGRSPFADVKFPADAGLIGERPHRFLKVFVITSIMIIPVINLWLSLYVSQDARLLFRSLSVQVLVLVVALLGAWSPEKPNATPTRSP